MTNRINTYDDLLKEKQRLKLLLQAQKELVRQDVNDIKQEFAPIKSAISVAGKFFTRDRHNLLLTSAADKVIDLVVRKLLLARAGWFTKLALPFLMKNFSSHVIADNKEKLFSKVFSFFSKSKANGKEKPVEAETEED